MRELDIIDDTLSERIPALKKAYALALKEYWDREEVRGIDIGFKYREKKEPAHCLCDFIWLRKR